MTTTIPVGDTALAVRVTGASAAATLGRVRGVAEALRAAMMTGVIDVVPSPDRVTVVYDPLRTASVATLAVAVAACAEAVPDAAAIAPAARHEIPVVYGGPHGPDLEVVTAAHGIDRDRLVALHTEPDYLVQAVGFLPGFAYLTGLPAALATPRRATPRVRVPRGSVGIGGGFTGVYPFESAGGWQLIGRSPAWLFDAARASPGRLAVGDRVRFRALDASELPADAWRTDVVPATTSASGGASDTTATAIEVLTPGLWTTIQDLGRPGRRADGVPLSGAADPLALRLANLLVGNRETAAAIEFTLVAPQLRFTRDTVVAVCGATFPGVPMARPFRVPAGTVVAPGHATHGCRGVLAVAGGIDVAPVLGSRSTLVVAGLGGFAGRPLAAGDRVPCGTAEVTIDAGWSVDPGLMGDATGACVLRMISGEQTDDHDTAIWSAAYRASSRSDRMGLRLEGPMLGRRAAAAGEATSVAVLPGTVQVPPDGQPIVLLADAQTIGGYPVVGHVITADLPRAAQVRPGETVRFRPCTVDEAHAALREREARIEIVRQGIAGRIRRLG
jgi:KipI family sensor histidine kinase inhibitor